MTVTTHAEAVARALHWANRAEGQCSDMGSTTALVMRSQGMSRMWASVADALWEEPAGVLNEYAVHNHFAGAHPIQEIRDEVPFAGAHDPESRAEAADWLLRTAARLGMEVFETEPNKARNETAGEFVVYTGWRRDDEGNLVPLTEPEPVKHRVVKPYPAINSDD